MNPNIYASSNYIQQIIVITLMMIIALYLANRNDKNIRNFISYIRLKIFSKFLSVVQPQMRKNRIKSLTKIVDFESGMRVIDLGGTSEIWEYVDVPLQITIVNLPGVAVDAISVHKHKMEFIEGDATTLSYNDNSFDIVFSNSVIEHVGSHENREKFAREVRRLAPAYCIQTPSIYFPLEAHTGIPLWWALPRRFREWHHRRWERSLPAWNEMVRGTTVIRKHELQNYFPDSKIVTERFLGIPKSYTAYRKRSAF
jgi:hypothetical protein